MSRLSPYIQTVLGPDTLHVGQAVHFSARWTFWFSDSGVRMGKFSSVMPPANGRGQACEVFGDELANHLSACFDQDSRPVVAVERNDGAVEVRRFQSGTETRFIWEGRQPQLYFNREVLYYSGDSDVVCFYLKADNRTIYARMQRDNFSVEYVMNEMHCNLATLEEAETAANKVRLYARTDGGRVVTLLSREYAPFPVFTDDAGYAVLALFSGNHRAVVVIASAVDAGHGTVSILDGAYYLRVQIATAQDAAVANASLDAGSYDQRVITAPAQADTATANASLFAGEHGRRVVPLAAAETASLVASLDSGECLRAVIGLSRREAGTLNTDIFGGRHYAP